jgi:hypothetical protein
MADLVEAFISGIRSVEPLSHGSDRRLAIRQKITESENLLRRSGGAAPALAEFLQQARRRASEEVSRHKRNNVPTRTAEFFQEVFEELSVRARLTVKEMPDDTFQIEVNVSASGWALPHVVKSDFYSVVAAQQWIDSDQGNTLVRAIIGKYEK